ncbi:MAG: type II toxin-antitoxin system Phd/YefM family antitoxin [Spirochaetaceae bacterium]|nr:type II toxin-antitoxin system Phd/YefM family antitoxin [Spirochaetaceae bacterium]
MYVSATEVQNNFGKYLKLCKIENVIITRNGKKQALLLYFPRNSKGFEAGEPFSDYGTSPRKEEPVSYQQFLEMTEKSENRYELIDGVVYLLASPGFTHQRILGVMHIVFHEYLKSSKKCDTFMAPFDINLIRQNIKLLREETEDDINFVQPDLIVLCDYLKEIDEKDKYQGTPTLVVEILSPSSRSKDRVKKLDLYMESGIEEFWIVDPKTESVMVYSFKEGELDADAFYTSGQAADSIRFPGLLVPLDKLF